MASNKPFQAQYDGTCSRCNRPVLGYQFRPKNESHWINIFNRPEPKSLFHVDCENPTVSPYTDSTEPESTPAPEPSNGNGHGNGRTSVEQSIRDLIETITPKPQPLDMAAIAAVIREEVDKAVAKTTRVVVIKDERRNVEVVIKNAHHSLEKLTRLVNRRKHVLLWGESGSGKSHTAAAIAEAMGLRFDYISLANQTPEWRLVGTTTANGAYLPGCMYETYKNGGVFCIDEIDAANDNLLTSLNSALANGHASFPVVGRVERHPDFICICTANTPALGASAVFTSRRPLDPATRDRFKFLRWDIDPKVERELTLAQNPDSEPWVKWIQAVRAYAKSSFPKLIVTMRAAIEGAELLLDSDVFTVAEIAEMVVFRGIDQDSVTKILAANPLPTLAGKAVAANA